MNVRQLLTVSVGIPAYNEEKNIIPLLESILRQRRINFTLEKIFVVSDGSADATDDLVRDFAKKHPVVALFADGKRLGQVSRLNQMYAMNVSDIFISFDGDTTLGHETTLEEIVNAFEDTSVGLVGGNDQPLPARTFLERIIIANVELWYNVRKDLNRGDTVYNHHGCVSALSRELCQKAAMPTDIVAQDTYLYFRAMELGLKFRYAKNALVYYRAPSSFKDYCAQVSRFAGTKPKITQHFGPWIEKYRAIDRKQKIHAFLKTFAHTPFLTLCAVALRVVTRIYLSRRHDQLQGAFWTPISSTKTSHKHSDSI